MGNEFCPFYTTYNFELLLFSNGACRVGTRAGRSPTFQDPGTRLDGLADTRESDIACLGPWGIQQRGLLPANLK